MLGIAFLGVCVWEAYALWNADAKTPEILAEWRAKPAPLKLQTLSADQKQILLKVEDPAFYDHKGIDFTSPGQGMTTITQGLVKLMYFHPFKPGFAKIEQSLIARFVLDPKVSKDEQLTFFLNQAYFGHHGNKQIYGFAEAAETYFSKGFQDLTRDEFIGLVAMLIGPNHIRPDNPKAYEMRVAKIKALLSGNCRPASLLDAAYTACTPSS